MPDLGLTYEAASSIWDLRPVSVDRQMVSWPRVVAIYGVRRPKERKGTLSVRSRGVISSCETDRPSCRVFFHVRLTVGDQYHGDRTRFCKYWFRPCLASLLKVCNGRVGQGVVLRQHNFNFTTPNIIDCAKSLRSRRSGLIVFCICWVSSLIVSRLEDGR